MSFSENMVLKNDNSVLFEFEEKLLLKNDDLVKIQLTVKQDDRFVYEISICILVIWLKSFILEILAWRQVLPVGRQ